MEWIVDSISSRAFRAVTPEMKAVLMATQIQTEQEEPVVVMEEGMVQVKVLAADPVLVPEKNSDLV